MLHLLTLSCIWLMQFNISKCRIVSVGKGNRSVDYTLNDTILGMSYSVRDLGAQVNSDLHTIWIKRISKKNITQIL